VVVVEASLSTERAWLLLSRHRRKMEAIGGATKLVAMSNRATNALRRLGIEPQEDPVAVKVLSKLAHARNCGRKPLEEIERWMTKDDV
jgi:DNA-directed RNA polymerase alpha subunit